MYMGVLLMCGCVSSFSAVEVDNGICIHIFYQYQSPHTDIQCIPPQGLVTGW